MNRLGIKSTVYHGESCLGEADVFPAVGNPPFQFPNNEIRISYFTAPSERCPPLSILQTISPFSVRCKVKARLAPSDQFPVHRLHTSCFQEPKTAVVVLGTEEIHMVAMRSKAEKSPCFWCFAVPVAVYHSCLAMLNLRCLSIVFDLDETLIVANSMKSFEDKIASLSHRIDAEDDPVRVSVMSAELKRYLEDRELLKQYTDTDSVMDSGRLVNVQNEEFPPLTLAGNHGAVVSSRPVIRLLEGNNVVLTRINPEIRDTSVLVRLRPAWEELRSYLTAKGRKRFEVFVCTMAERDYALEIWRLLDPEAHLISAKQLQERIVCVKPGSRKSLLNVFQTGSCIPKMSMVIDDRLEVWDDRDQPRVHVVPAFAPYYAPQAETANAVPVLCVARNVACNVRGGFFREFDENLLRRVVLVAHEDEILDLPVPPDASDYLMVVGEETAGIAANRDNNAAAAAGLDGMVMMTSGAAEAERRPPNQPQLPVISEGNQRGGAPLPQAPQQNKPPFQPDGSLMASSLSIGVLLEIGRKCDSKVEFRPVASGNKDFQFSFEAVFNSEKIGVGVGRTKKEAQFQAADNALCFLANQYVEFISPDVRNADKDLDNPVQAENGFLGPS